MKKRSAKRNVWGNVVGYEGGRRAEEFGHADYADLWAELWVSGMSREEAECRALDSRTREPVHGVGHMQGRGAA